MQSTLMPLDEAKKKIAQVIENTNFLPESLLLPIDEVIDHILAENIIAPIPVPAFDNSAMDGYAFKKTENTVLHCVGQCFAGEIFEAEIKPGECVAIMTGAPIPKGADTVVMQEQTERYQNDVTLLNVVNLGANIRKIGIDIELGETILKQGKRLSPSDIGLLASLGIDKVMVYKPLNIALFSTGNELQVPGEKLKKGCIFDSNRFAIEAILKRLGVNVINLGIIPDSREALSAAFIQAGNLADVVISTGGVSVGEADYTKEILTETGEIAFWKLAIKPGKPLAFGQLTKIKKDNQPIFFGLPGNPVSALLTFHQIALPCIQRMAGECLTDDFILSSKTRTALNKKPGRTDFQRAKLITDAQGQVFVEQKGDQSSALLSSISTANALLILEQDRGNIDINEEVMVKPFDRWLI